MKTSPLSFLPLCIWGLHSSTEPGADPLFQNWAAGLDPKVKNLLEASHCWLSTAQLVEEEGLMVNIFQSQTFTTEISLPKFRAVNLWPCCAAAQVRK